jgi:hypothetical protein
MGSKAWRNLGAIFLACAGLVGCNNGPEKVGGPFSGQPRAQQNTFVPNTNNSTIVGQGTRSPTTLTGPAGTAGQSFQPPSPGAFPNGPGFNNNSSLPSDPYQRLGNNNMSIPTGPSVPTTPVSGPSPFARTPPPVGSFPPGPAVPPMPTPPQGFGRTN